jgi:thiamine-phosphate pyrophosphorylase
MGKRFLLYYITDRAALGGDERTRRLRLLGKIGEAAERGVDYIQLREKDLCGRDLELLAGEAMRILRATSARGGKATTTLLINSRTDIALATGAGGVHLRGDDVSPKDVRAAWKRSAGDGKSPDPIISVACHSVEEVAQAAADGASFAVFAPVFEKKDAAENAPVGLEGLRQACRLEIPVFALGGVTLENAESCRRAGAAGIAGIRLFQENDIGAVVRELRGR